MIYFTSDLHFGHDRSFIYKPRGYETIEEMNEDILRKWNETVTDEDTVYVLGDLMLGNNEIGMSYLRQLKGHIHIILGNHDTDARIKLYKTLPKVEAVEYATMVRYKGYSFFLTHYPCNTGNLEKESLKRMTCNIYGHTHQSNNFYEDRPYMYHCGLDSHTNYPVSADEVIADMVHKVEECKSFLQTEKKT